MECAEQSELSGQGAVSPKPGYHRTYDEEYGLLGCAIHVGGAISMSKRLAATNVKLKRAYDPPAASDGTRILIDRLWPRGVSKANAAIDQWDKSIAPSTMLRNWFRHDH